MTNEQIQVEISRLKQEVQVLKNRLSLVEKIQKMIVTWINFWETVKTPWKVTKNKP